MLCSSGRLGDEPQQDFTRIDVGIAEAPVQHLGADCCLRLDLARCASVPAADREFLVMSVRSHIEAPGRTRTSQRRTTGGDTRTLQQLQEVRDSPIPGIEGLAIVRPTAPSRGGMLVVAALRAAYGGVGAA
jgi:hypothetical protein